jgi:hypothetical protein
MGCTVLKDVAVEVSLDTRNQTREKVTQIVEHLLRSNGAIECGILGFLSFRLGEGSDRKVGSDPEPELKKLGVTSVKTTKSK